MLIGNLPNNVIRYDRLCRAIYASPSMEKVNGKGASEKLLGKTPTEAVTETVYDVSEYQSKIEYVIATGETVEMELKAPQPTGEVQIHHIRIIPEFSENGEISGALAVGGDITERKAAEEMIHLLTHSINASSEQFFLIRTDYPSFIYVNDKAAKTLGYTKEELTSGKGVFDIDPDVNNMELWKDHVRRLEKEGSRVFETRHRSKNGKVYPVEIRSNFFTHNGGRYILSIANDITEKKKMEKALMSHKQELQSLAESSPGIMGSFHLKADGSICMPYVSPNISEILGLNQQDVMKDAEIMILWSHPEDRERIRQTIEESARSMTVWHEEYRILHPEKGIRWMESNTKPEPHPEGGVVWYGYVHDITERKLVEQKIEYLAYYDSLTGFPNRILAKEQINQLIADAKLNKSKIALLFMDLDDFKSINDSLGHTAGDAMLRAAASRLAENTRKNDIISRLGGDEFLLAITDISSLDYASSTARMLQESFEKPFHTGSHILSTSMSIGISIYPDDGNSFDALLQRADTALYKAKESGKKAFCFFKEHMNTEIMNNVRTQNDLKTALENNEFVLYYQPQIDTESSAICGVEALLRWNHPVRGLVPPSEFIPVAESSGLIVQIGKWVLEEACCQAAKWSQTGIDITMAVNISAVQFRRSNLEETVKRALKDSGLNPELLELELTESILIHDTENVLNTIKRLKKIGVKLSIDDFGTGYSSLSYLKRFAVDKLKIDQSFVRELHQNQEDAAIVRAVVQMAKSLNLRTIAEGIESENILQILAEYGCNEVQGYYFSKPVPHHLFEDFFWQCRQ